MVDLLKSLVTAVVLSVLSLACSTVPDFKPSVSPEKAANFKQAAEICGEYRIKDDKTDRIKVAELVPWIRCFEVVIKRFPEARENEGFVTFFRALNGRHEYTAAPEDWLPEPRLMNRLVRHVIGSISNSKLELPSDLLAYAHRELPRYGEFLDSKHRPLGGPDRRTRHVSELGVLAQDLSQALSAPRAQRTSLSGPQKAFCKRHDEYLDGIEQLRELMEYRDTLSESSASSEVDLLAKVTARVQSLKENLLTERAEISQNRLKNTRCYR